MLINHSALKHYSTIALPSTMLINRSAYSALKHYSIIELPSPMLINCNRREEMWPWLG